MKLSLALALAFTFCLFHLGRTAVPPRRPGVPPRKHPHLPPSTCLNVCFIFDGSDPAGVDIQKNFAELIELLIAGIPASFKFGAVLADGRSATNVQKLGDSLQLDDLTQPDPVPAGVKYGKALKKCMKQTKKSPAQANAIVLFGSNPPLDAKKAAKLVRKWTAWSEGNSVFAVAGEGVEQAPYEAISGNSVLSPTAFFELTDSLASATVGCPDV